MSVFSTHIRPTGIGARWSLAIPIMIAAFVVFSETTYPEVAWSALLASVSCVLVFASARFKLFSFVTLAGIGHMVYYPVAAFSNLLLDYPAVREDLWESADLAMLGCAVGCFGLALGAFLYHRIRFDTRRDISTGISSGMLYNVILFSMVPVVVFLMLVLGVYYHGAISSDYQFESAIYLNMLTTLNWVGYTGMFLQVRRYYITRNKFDAILSALMVIIAIILFIPSGSRTSAILFLPLLMLYLFNIENNNIKKLFLLSIAVLVLIAITVVLGNYRNMQIKGLSDIKGGFSAIEEASDLGLESKEASLALVVNRFSDFVATGRIIDFTPTVFPYRGLEGVFNWWQMFVPGLLRPDLTIGGDGPLQALKYGVSPPIGFVAPVMIIGDLFSRGGWIFVFIGMVVVGYLLGGIDDKILKGDSVFSVIFFVLYGRGVLLICSNSLLHVFLLFSRDLIVIYLISYGLYKLQSIFKYKVLKTYEKY